MPTPIIRPATSADFPGILTLLIAAFSDSNPAHARFEQIMPETIRDDKAILDNWYIALDGGKVIASTQIVAQKFLVAPGIEIRVGGIGQVSCLPGHRGKGLMTDLLNATIARMTTDGYHVSILGGDRQRYRRFGWEVAGAARNLYLHGRRIDGKSVLPADDNRPTRWIGDQATIDQIHAAHQKNISRILRTREETRLCLERTNIATWIHSRGNDFAYICLQDNRIAEYGGDLAAFEELLSFILARRGLSVQIPAEEGSGPLEALMLQFAGHFSQNPVDMVRIFSLKSILEAYRPLLSCRLAAWQGSVVLEVADSNEKVQVSHFPSAGGALQIATTSAAADLKLDRPTWSPTLFGPFTQGIPADPKLQSFIRQAFPLPIIWPPLSQI